jgi:hypothetical protein
MRGAIIVFSCLLLAFAWAGAGAPLRASDLEPPRQDYTDDRQEVADFCYEQRRICRKICRLRFRDDDVGCPQSCDARVARCRKTGCYRWTDPDYLIAQRFGGFQCMQ